MWSSTRKEHGILAPISIIRILEFHNSNGLKVGEEAEQIEEVQQEPLFY